MLSSKTQQCDANLKTIDGPIHGFIVDRLAWPGGDDSGCFSEPIPGVPKPVDRS